MIDLERVVPCVPGARVIEKTGETAVTARSRSSSARCRMNYSGPAEIVEQDDSAASGGHGRSREGGGRARATPTAKVSMQLTGTGDATEVALHSQIDVTGKAAQMGEG